MMTNVFFVITQDITLAFILYLTFYLIITKYIPDYLMNNNKELHLLTNNNKDVKKMAKKHLPSYYVVIKVPKDNNFFILGL